MLSGTRVAVRSEKKILGTLRSGSMQNPAI